MGGFIAPALGILGGLLGSKGQKQTRTESNTYTGVDSRLWEYNPMEREGLRSAQLGLVGELFGQMPGGAGFWGGGNPGAGFGGGGGGHAGAGSAAAEYIGPDSWVYQMEAPAPWMENMLSRGKEYIGSATEDALRMQRDQAVRSGMSTSSPAYAYMVALQRRTQQEKLANALRDARLAWTLPAADREAGRLGQNAQMGTNVSMTNAQLRTQANIANAQLAEAAASRRAAAAQFGAQYARQGYGQLFDMLSSMIKPSAEMRYLQTGGKTTAQSGGGLQGAIAGGLGGFGVGQQIEKMMGLGGGGGGSLTGNDSGWGGVGGPVYSPQSNYPQQLSTMGMPNILPDWYGGGYNSSPISYAR